MKMSEEQPTTEQGDTEDQGQDVPNESSDAEATTNQQSEEETVPEKYEFQRAEQLAVKEHVLEEFQNVAKDMGLSQSKAQALIDLANKNAVAQQQAQQEAWNKQRETWVNELKSDQDFGGQKFDETISRAQRALTNFGSDNLKQLLNDSGLGDNPELVRLLAKVDRATSEKEPVEGGPVVEDSFKSAASILYPDQ
jgi:hypothetical protein